ncbi:hypothetical protein SAMN05518672_106184 [Chitinophaga sp. CF118]|uniref:hypothetical protein n=1 Tax=Chitinophaga sp. CF118 TaxID=1884367 RepID=UPI0008F1EB6A|nr:hypothetical protein [Chitinophaga sp. CF118]SFE45548.1 hypothetical protein SAMN05518672_106184 [Chitinophaga sp. CF118]
MKQLLFFIMMITCWLPSFAQTEGYVEHNLWNVQSEDTLMIFADKAYIRREPSLQSVITDSLSIGSSVIIKGGSAGTPLMMKGIVAPWKQVHYAVAGKERKGYIWLGLLALKHCTKDSIDFLYGIDKVRTDASDKKPLKYCIQVKAIDQKSRLLDMKEFPVSGSVYATSTEGKLLGDMGLEKLSTILRVSFSGDNGEARGIPTEYYYFGWTGSKFLLLPGKSVVSEGGIVYYGDTLLYPKETGGEPGKIIKLTMDGEVCDDGKTIVKKSNSKEIYVWDGQKAVKQ